MSTLSVIESRVPRGVASPSAGRLAVLVVIQVVIVIVVAAGYSPQTATAAAAAGAAAAVQTARRLLGAAGPSRGGRR